MNTLYPIFLKTENTEILIVGGGAVALEKISYLLKSSPLAKITLVAPEIHPEIILLAHLHKQVILIQKEFEAFHLIGKKLAIIATANRELNKSIKQKANHAGLLANVADTPDLCDFYLGSVVTKGNLKIAVSTNGKSPTLAKRIREFLEEAIPENINETLHNLETIIKSLTGNFTEKLLRLREITAVISGDNSKAKVFTTLKPRSIYAGEKNN
jgi:siroheme synthase-like protein